VFNNEHGKDSRTMPKVVAGIAALVALAAGILANVDPLTNVGRAGVAFAVGWFGTQFWYVFFTVRAHSLNEAMHSVADQGDEAQAA
jgi:hypothetical protein